MDPVEAYIFAKLPEDCKYLVDYTAEMRELA